MEPRNRTPDASHSLALYDEPEFLVHLEQTLEDCARGRPGALIHLDVARARDIRATCGDDALSALRNLATTVTYNQLGPTVPACLSDDCGLSLILRNMRPLDAAVRAKRLLGSLDDGTFTWHGHPFRLGVHIGVVELGPGPGAVTRWIHLAREACEAAQELGGSGIRVVPLDDHALRDLARDRDWHDHLAEII